MPKLFDRSRLSIKPLASRQSKSDTTLMIATDAPLPQISSEATTFIKQLAAKIRLARKNGAPVIMAYGAHLFKNGLAGLVIELMEAGYLQHLVTNGAGSIHDWEMAFQGKTEEDVRRYIQEGQFGIWQETGFFINLAVILGIAEGIGYGAAVGKMIHEDQLEIPSPEILKKQLEKELEKTTLSEQFPAKANLLRTVQQFALPAGAMQVFHPHKHFSIQAAAYRLDIPFNVCPGIGADIIYSHPLNNGAAIGQAALRDFLIWTEQISQLEGGVFLCVGSAVMGPMIFEKSIAMARNVALQENRPLENYQIVVNDIQPGTWDWNQGEPPKDHPAYYLRFCKSFSRMGGEFHYLELDNRAFIQHLHHRLCPKNTFV